jgi:hypothetical protein
MYLLAHASLFVLRGGLCHAHDIHYLSVRTMRAFRHAVFGVWTLTSGLHRCYSNLINNLHACILSSCFAEATLKTRTYMRVIPPRPLGPSDPLKHW